MGKLVIVLVIVLGGVVLWLTKPWEDGRYDNSPAGQEAKKTDAHVQQALDWTPPDKIEAREYFGTQEDERRNYGHLDYAEMKAFVEDLYSKGAKEVCYINVERSVRTGDHPEGLVIVLPNDPQKRQAIFGIMAPHFAAVGKTTPPPDVKQKYLYIGYDPDRWNPEKSEPGFMPL
jgi:hypothetical protein